MKKLIRKTWFWLLSGVAVLLGIAFQSCNGFEGLYGPPKVYGPPTELPNDTIPD
ncbi:MAG: hypothetical protein J6W26_01410 [Bacteroidales bacterium]|nr:hypothetical protein [Bacteroidales bacterium]